MNAWQYCSDLFSYQRFPTREVKIGGVVIGGQHPICLQSMTTTDTMDTAATVAQSIRMIKAGCELVRITAPSKSEAENLFFIKEALREKGYDTPLSADIHFTPNAAEVAASIVEKVRINPGNYADKKRFESIEYTEEGYQNELERIRRRFTPLILLCKKNGTALRIGTNHGSLSDRILSRYGDTPLGMVESAMEFLRICEAHAFFDIVVSMKASNTHVMVQAYRLFVHTMMQQGMNYPLHLGVTEAGDGEDGRIKSAVGIGALLEDGLGDTIRVSLTEEPEAEIPVARILAERYAQRSGHDAIVCEVPIPVNPFEYNRRHTRVVGNIGGRNVPRVIIDLSHKSEITPASLFSAGHHYSVPQQTWKQTDQACDYIYCGKHIIPFTVPEGIGMIMDVEQWRKSSRAAGVYPLMNVLYYLKETDHSKKINFISASYLELTDELMVRLKNDPTAVLMLNTKNKHGMAEQRAAFFTLIHAKCEVPVVIHRSYQERDEDRFTIYASADTGALLLDGLGDGLMISAPDMPVQKVNTTTFGILQATRTRISKTEYISCPSCGRTLFDLQETTAKIRARTSHLKGIKIGIMGCIVNGPGEMADADYGYVGTGEGKITLYKEKNIVKKNIPSGQAVDALIELLKVNGDWVEPPLVE